MIWSNLARVGKALDADRRGLFKSIPSIRLEIYWENAWKASVKIAVELGEIRTGVPSECKFRVLSLHQPARPPKWVTVNLRRVDSWLIVRRFVSFVDYVVSSDRANLNAEFQNDV